MNGISMFVNRINIFIITLLPCLSSAHEVSIHITGISYHIGANDKNPAYKEAPRGLDKNGAFVFNPGIGLYYDLREKENNGGFSLAFGSQAFSDCNAKMAYYAGVGPKYRYYLNHYLSIDADLILGLYLAQDWDKSKYNMSIYPIPSLGFMYHFDNEFVLGLKTIYAPSNNTHSSTAGFNILFGYLSFGYKF